MTNINRKPECSIPIITVVLVSDPALSSSSKNRRALTLSGQLFHNPYHLLCDDDEPASPFLAEASSRVSGRPSKVRYGTQLNSPSHDYRYYDWEMAGVLPRASSSCYLHF